MKKQEIGRNRPKKCDNKPVKIFGKVPNFKLWEPCNLGTASFAHILGSNVKNVNFARKKMANFFQCSTFMKLDSKCTIQSSIPFRKQMMLPFFERFFWRKTKIEKRNKRSLEVKSPLYMQHFTMSKIWLYHETKNGANGMKMTQMQGKIGVTKNGQKMDKNE